MKTKSDSSFILHPSSLPMRPYALRSTPHALPGGMSLLEVLIAMGVLTLGLLGILSVIPLAQYSLRETNKSDAAITCGRSALSEIKIRRLADFRWWYWQGGNWATGETYANQAASLLSHPVILDPLGFTKLNAAATALGRNNPDLLGGDPGVANGYLYRYTLASVFNNRATAMAITPVQAIFDWRDDLAFQPPQSKDERPTVFTSGLNYDGNYSWFATLMPSTEDTATGGGLTVLPVGSRRIFDVSTVVCYKRDFSVDADACPVGEWTANVSSVAGFGYGGGTIGLGAASFAPYLTNSGGTDAALPEQATLRENNWVMLWARNAAGEYCSHWYRVINADLESTTPTATLEGPDWDATRWPTSAANPIRMWVVKGVIGVYNSRIELDADSIFGGQQ